MKEMDRADPTISKRAVPPSLYNELRRGFHPFNLAVAVGVAIAGAALSLLPIVADALRDLTGLKTPTDAAWVAVVLFAVVTSMHVAGHAYFGWRFGRGLSAEQVGDHGAAVRLLGPASNARFGHFDPHGIAADALIRCKAVLSKADQLPPSRDRM